MKLNEPLYAVVDAAGRVLWEEGLPPLTATEPDAEWLDLVREWAKCPDARVERVVLVPAAELDELRADLADALSSTLANTSSYADGWYEVDALRDGVYAGDQLVKLCGWEKRPGGVGRCQAYRPPAAR